MQLLWQTMNLKLDILKSFLIYHKKEGNEYLFECPFCQIGKLKHKLSVNIIKNTFRCWICGPNHIKSKKLINLVKINNDAYARWVKLTGAADNIDKCESYINNLLNRNEDLVDKLQFPSDFQILLYDYFDEDNKYVNYLKNRGLSYKDFLYWKPGISNHPKFENRIIFPSFDVNGEYNYYISRTISDYDPDKYRNSWVNKFDIIFNEHNINWNKDIYLVEGVFDAINLNLNTVILLGTELNEKSQIYQKLITFPHNIYILLDTDAEKKSEKIVEQLVKYNRKVYNVKIDPFKDPGEVPKSEIDYYLNYSSTYYSSSFDYIKGKYEKL